VSTLLFSLQRNITLSRSDGIAEWMPEASMCAGTSDLHHCRNAVSTGVRERIACGPRRAPGWKKKEPRPKRCPGPKRLDRSGRWM